MNKKATICLFLMSFALLLASGCAGEKASMKTENAPTTGKEIATAKNAESTQADSASKEASADKTKSSPSDPAAKVGSSTITSGELDRAMNVLASQNRIQLGTTPEATKEAQKAALDQLIYAELIYQEGLKTPPADLEKVWPNDLGAGRAVAGDE